MTANHWQRSANLVGIFVKKVTQQIIDWKNILWGNTQRTFHNNIHVQYTTTNYQAKQIWTDMWGGIQGISGISSVSPSLPNGQLGNLFLKSI